MAQLHGATLNGIVNPSGFDATAWFEYGVDTTYGTVVNLPDTLTGIADIPVTTDLTGLLATTTYHFRLVASNASGTVQGLDEVFTTLADAAVLPVVTTLPATNIS